MFNYTFHWNQALRALPQMLDGAVVTLQVAVLSMVIGVACAIALTVFRLSGSRILGGIATTWVEVARNTPALFQIYMAIGPVAGGVIYDVFASYGWLYIGAWGIGIGAFLIALTFKPFPKRRPAAAAA